MERLELYFGIFVALFSTVNSALSSGQINVCQQSVSYYENVTVSTISSVRIKELTWCLGVIPRCTKWRTQYRTKYKQVKRVASRLVYVCCPGYQQMGDLCRPHCPSGCVHGNCDAPGLCRCDVGWRGANCNSGCPDGTWGGNCAYSCECTANNGECDVQTGHCHCNPGFRGRACHLRCPTGTFGPDCEQDCECVIGQATCDPVTGRCQCGDGFYGPLCSKTCPEQLSGQRCPDDCPCQHDGTCNDDGTCDCPGGWTGPVCAARCPVGTFGVNCERHCVCYNNGSCHHISGECSCTAGYTGHKCEKSCAMGKFGVDCLETCACENEAYCSHTDGKCTCTSEWMGLRCQLKVCPAGFYGPSCSSACKCILENSQCDSWTGACTCYPGYQGTRCEQRCVEGYFGPDCIQKCHCQDNERCQYIYGCVADTEVNSVQDKTDDEKGPSGVSLILIMNAVCIILILLVVLCFVIYYTRRYQRFKHTTELVVEYTRADMGDPAVCSSQGAEASGGAVAQSEKSKMLEATAGASYSERDYDCSSDLDEDAAGARRPIYTARRAHAHNSPHAPPRNKHNRRRARDNDDLDEHTALTGLPEEPPPPYTPTPQLPSPPPPYSVDTPATKGSTHTRSQRTRAHEESLGAHGGSDTLDYSDDSESTSAHDDINLQNQNTENESRENSVPV